MFHKFIKFLREKLYYIFVIVAIIVYLAVMIISLEGAKDNSSSETKAKSVSFKSSATKTLDLSFDNSIEFFENLYLTTEKIKFDSFIDSKATKEISSLDKELIYESVVKYGGKENKELIYSIIAKESEFNKTAKSYLGSKYGRGLMQVSEIGLADYNSKNGKHYTSEMLDEININIMIGCWIYNQNKQYINSDDETLLLTAFNRGYCDVKYKGYTSTKYSRDILEYKEELKNWKFFT